jgi:hypothetical protein
MNKVIDPTDVRAEVQPRTARTAGGRSRRMPDSGTTIAGGSQEPRLAVARWLQASGWADTPVAGSGGAVPGGLQKAPVRTNADGTVALSDGSRITFNQVAPASELETA